MNKGILLKIGHVPWRYAAGRIHIPGVEIVGGDWSLTVDGKTLPLEHIRPPAPGAEPEKFARALTRSGRRRVLPIVVGPYLKRELRRALESAGVSYLDFYGNVHLVTQDQYIHIEARSIGGETKTLGVAGVRAAQTVLEGADRDWGVRELAEAAGVSPAQAQRVFAVLEGADLVTTSGAGPNKKRHVSDRGRLLDWLTTQVAGKRPRHKLQCALYARRPEDLMRRIAKGLTDIRFALTGSAAASLFDVGPTSIPLTIVRIHPDWKLDAAASALGAEVTNRGPNIELWSDVGALGTRATQLERGLPIAPKSRIYIDLTLERRGEDLAALFRERVLGY